jgi:hypothetical protein
MSRRAAAAVVERLERLERLAMTAVMAALAAMGVDWVALAAMGVGGEAEAGLGAAVVVGVAGGEEGCMRSDGQASNSVGTRLHGIGLQVCKCC